MTIVVPLVCFVIPLLIGLLAVGRGLAVAVPIMTLMFVLIAVWAIWQGRQMQGFDGIGYAILAILMAAPAALGSLAGGGIGLWRKRKAGREGRSDDADA